MVSPAGDWPQGQKLPITVAMVVYRGEETIERALKSVADIADEIIVSHNGPCRDRSVEIARRYTDRVYVQNTFIGAPEAYRVFVYERATHDWILQVDADEFLSEELREHLWGLIADPAVHGYEFRWPTWYRGKYYSAYTRLCLFRKQFFYLIGAPSEHLKPVHQGVVVRHVPYVMEHKPPYDNLTLATFRRKWVPWARIQAEYYRKDFHSIPKYNYPRADWEFRTRIRVRHPLVLGVFGTSLFHLALGVWYFLKSRHVLFLKSGVLHGLASIVLYGDLWKYQRFGLPAASADVAGSHPHTLAQVRSARASETTTAVDVRARSG